jgi:hypothetical protein
MGCNIIMQILHKFQLKLHLTKGEQYIVLPPINRATCFSYLSKIEGLKPFYLCALPILLLPLFLSPKRPESDR